jgi:hypothetical protein
VIEVIKTIERYSYISGLTERIQKMLWEKEKIMNWERLKWRFK